MTDIELYNAALNFLLAQDGITKADLKTHFSCEFQKPRDIKLIFLRLCFSAQNKQMSGRVIGRSIGGIPNLAPVLFDFDPEMVAQKYSPDGGLVLLQEVIKVLKPTGQVRMLSNSLWPQFCQTVIDCAYFLNEFKTANAFYEWADSFAKNSNCKPALPLLISLEISGFGFPLACDFLKELGYMEFGKPDVHLKDIFQALGLLPMSASSLKQDYMTLKIIDRIANANNVTPYAVDKLFWLIGTGNFYRTNKKIKPQKVTFLESMGANPNISRYTVA